MPVIKSGQTRMTSFLYVYNYIFPKEASSGDEREGKGGTYNL
jgi:hypothetical protein